MDPGTQTVESSSEEKGVWRWNKPIDIGTSREFYSRAVDVMSGKGPIVMDLSESTHLDACGLQILVALAVQALTRGRLFEIAKASYAIQRDLQLAGVGYLLRQE